VERLSRVTKASLAPPDVVCDALRTGKSVLEVTPVTSTPTEWAEMALPPSAPAPPR